MSDASFRLIVRQGIDPGKLDEFKGLACQFTEGLEAAEPGTLGYEWFIAEDGGECYLNEFYADSEAFLAHFAGVGSKIAIMLEISPMIEAVVLGDPSPEAREALSKLGARFYSAHTGFAR
jgi:quinol monooxygenase YgiN